MQFVDLFVLVGSFAPVILVLTLSMRSVSAEEVNQFPDGGASLLSPEALSEGELSNPEGLPVETEIVDVADQPFQKALRVKTGRPTAEWWAIQFVMTTEGPVRKGDALLATFRIRAVETSDETGEAYLRAVFQSERPPWNKSLLAQWGAGRKWRTVQCPFLSVEDYAPGSASLTFAFMAGPQVIEIGG